VCYYLANTYPFTDCVVGTSILRIYVGHRTHKKALGQEFYVGQLVVVIGLHNCVWIASFEEVIRLHRKGLEFRDYRFWPKNTLEKENVIPKLA
jgi:hypothetical protein